MKLLREGRSFSGRERNCIFLNCRGARFANISAISGLDFPDDGRALAVVDWDQDGDLDLWLHNRTGPRLRLMLNRTNADSSQSQAGFLALRLQGTNSNRDAIGARVEVLLAGAKARDRLPLIQTLYAGDGYLSQSSKWMHFGLGHETKVQSVLVHWPGGKVERFQGIESKHRYLLVEGTGKVKPIDSPRTALKLAASIQTPLPPDAATRTFLSNRLPMPILRTAQFDDTETRAIELGGGRAHDGPMLINFWASWCMPCVAELNEFTEHEAQLREIGLDILALSLDGLDKGHSSKPSDAQRVLRDINFPFQSGIATAELLDKLGVVQRIVLNRQRPLAVPTSILLDRTGRLAIVYRGPVSINVLREDVAQLETTGDVTRDLAVPFPGRWNSAPRNLLLHAVASVFKERGYVEDHDRYLEMDIELKEKTRQAADSIDEQVKIDQQYAGMHFNLARSLDSQGKTDEAISHYRQGLAVKPNDALAQYYLGRALSSIGQATDAIKHFQQALRANPQLAVAHFQLGVAMTTQNQRGEAIKQFRHAIANQPNHAEAHINLGVLLASAGKLDAGIEHLNRAVQLKPDGVQARMNLGAALGSKGDFPRAADQFRRVTAMRPDLPQAQARLARMLLKCGDEAGAVVHFEKAVSLNPADGNSALRLAWLRATSPVDSLRDATQATKLAERINHATGGKDPRVLDTLAAAYAEGGDFEAAVRTANQALEQLEPDHDEIAATIRERAELYRKRQPYRGNVAHFLTE